MKIVIDIHEKDYQTIKNGHIPFSVLDAIMKGTPLPKGHGRLIDADWVINNRLSNGFCDWYDEIKDAPTIIEAEGSESE